MKYKINLALAFSLVGMSIVSRANADKAIPTPIEGQAPQAETTRPAETSTDTPVSDELIEGLQAAEKKICEAFCKIAETATEMEVHVLQMCLNNSSGIDFTNLFDPVIKSAINASPTVRAECLKCAEARIEKLVKGEVANDDSASQKLTDLVTPAPVTPAT